MNYFNPHTKAIICKLLKRLCIWYAVILPVSLQMTCLPASSKEIDKARDRDNKENELRKIQEKKYNAYKKEAGSIKNKITQLLGTPPNVTAFNKDELTKICKKFLEQVYIPYLNAAQQYWAHEVKYKTDALERQEYKSYSNYFKIRVAEAQVLLKAGKPEELCEFILKIE